MISIMNSFWSESLSEIFKILLYIDGVIYNFVAVIFGLIIDLSSANFVTSDIVDMLLDRIYIIVGVLALFLITYALIKSLFDPNNAFKGKKSAVNVIKNMMIAIVLTVLMPTIFTYLYRFQSIIIDSNVISAIVLGSGSNSDGVLLCVKDPGDVTSSFLPKNPTNITCGDGYILLNFNAENSGYRNYVKMASNEMAFTALNTFLFAEDDFTELDNKAGGWEILFGSISFGSRFLLNPIGTVLGTVQNIYNDANNINFADVRFHSVAYGNFMYITNLARAVSFGEGADVGTGEVTYYMVLSTICGLALLGLAVVTCVNLALRILKLFALEILSPIACFSMVIPDSKIFDRWLKETITTYLDLFFRLITFNLCILLFGQIHAITDSFEGRTGLLLDLFIIAGLLIFINEAPKMIKDILGIKTNDQKLLKRMFGGTVGSVLSGGAGFLGGLAGGAFGASRAAFDPATNGKSFGKIWSKTRNIGAGALSGIGTGKNAAKAKNFGDWKNAIDSGIQNSVKANQQRNLKDARNGSVFSKEGIKNRVSNMGNYITGNSPTSALNKYNADYAATKDTVHSYIDKLEDKVKNSTDTVTLQNGNKLSVKEAKRFEEAASVKYNDVLSGNYSGLKNIGSFTDWSEKYKKNVMDNLKMDPSALSNYNQKMADIANARNHHDVLLETQLQSQLNSMLQSNADLKAYDDYQKNPNSLVTLYNAEKVNADTYNQQLRVQAKQEYDQAVKDRKEAVSLTINKENQNKGSEVNVIYEELKRKLNNVNAKDNEYAHNIDFDGHTNVDVNDANVIATIMGDFTKLKDLEKSIKKRAVDVHNTKPYREALEKYQDEVNKDNK